MSRTIKRILGALFLLALAAGVALVFRPKPLEVETGPVTRGPMQVTIDEDADTRAHDRFTLAAPVAGQLSRISLHEGDKVMPGTVIAPFLWTRARKPRRAPVSSPRRPCSARRMHRWLASKPISIRRSAI
jgi:hypothetical protein